MPVDTFAPYSQNKQKALNSQLPPLKTSVIDLEHHMSKAAARPSSTSKGLDLQDVCTTQARSSDTDSAVSGTFREPTLLETPRINGRRARGHSLSKSVAHIDLEPGNAEEVKASLEQIASNGPIPTLEEARSLRAQEREKIKRIRSDSIALIRERTRSRQASLSSQSSGVRVESFNSTLCSPSDSVPPTPSIMLINAAGETVVLGAPDHSDSLDAAIRIQSQLDQRAENSISSTAGKTPLEALPESSEFDLTTRPATNTLYNGMSSAEGPAARYARLQTQNIQNAERGRSVSRGASKSVSTRRTLNERMHATAETSDSHCADSLSLTETPQVGVAALHATRVPSALTRPFHAMGNTSGSSKRSTTHPGAWPTDDDVEETASPTENSRLDDLTEEASDAATQPSTSSTSLLDSKQEVSGHEQENGIVQEASSTMSTPNDSHQQATQAQDPNLSTLPQAPSTIARAYRSKSCSPKFATFSLKPSPDPAKEDSHEAGDLSDSDSDTPKPTTENHTYTPWAQRCAWFYLTTSAEFNTASMAAGLVPVILPPYTSPASIRLGHHPTASATAPADFSPTSSATRQPNYIYDSNNDRFIVQASRFPFADSRADPGHPDHLPGEKLARYQAFEFAGFNVWRHDRNTLSCALPACGKDVQDHDYATQICLGCGPKSFIRYCCREHLVEDVPEHWAECGGEEVLIMEVVDEATQPARFFRRFPWIEDRSGWHSLGRHWQVVHAVFHRGQYTIFPQGGVAAPVEWPEAMRETMLPRVERLLNVAFYDHTCKKAISYLYRLLRFCLRVTGHWNHTNASLLPAQFLAEFGYEAPVVEWFADEPCECEWSGEFVFVGKLKGHHHSDCVLAVKGVGEIGRGKGVEEMVEEYERNHWKLRAWRRRMGVSGWRKRVGGEGFGEVNVEEMEWFEGDMWNSWGNVW